MSFQTSSVSANTTETKRARRSSAGGAWLVTGAAGAGPPPPSSKPSKVSGLMPMNQPTASTTSTVPSPKRPPPNEKPPPPAAGWSRRSSTLLELLWSSHFMWRSQADKRRSARMLPGSGAQKRPVSVKNGTARGRHSAGWVDLAGLGALGRALAGVQKSGVAALDACAFAGWVHRAPGHSAAHGGQFTLLHPRRHRSKGINLLRAGAVQQAATAQELNHDQDSQYPAHGNQHGKVQPLRPTDRSTGRDFHDTALLLGDRKS